MKNTNRMSNVLFLTAVNLLGLHSPELLAQGKQSGPTQSLSSRFPGVEVRNGEDGVVAVFGQAMSSAATADKAADAFLQCHADALGAPGADLRLDWQADLGSGKGTVFSYRQFMQGYPVDGTGARILVMSSTPRRVVYAAGRLIADRGTIQLRSVSGQAVRESLRLRPEHNSLLQWLEPELVVYAGETDSERIAPVLAWKLSALGERRGEPRAVSFFVNASTGRTIFIRDEIHHGAPISGRITGLATTGTLPDVPLNPPVETPLTDMFIRDGLGTLAITDADGNYVIDGDGSVTTLSASLAGPFVEVRDALNTPPLLSQSMGPPGPANFLFNPVPSEATTAQVNALVHTNATRNFYREYQPDFTELDVPVTANVNGVSISCNAFFTPVGLSINFFQSDSRCVNTAYSSVINHEYAHFIVNQLRLAQGSFGEGFADCVAMLMQDEAIIGRDFFGPGTAVRDVETANQQYPCSNENHVCGQILGGVWWDIKRNMQALLGDEEGLEQARQLFTDWSLITLGGRFKNSAHPGTAIEVLTTDDDDADLANGTPHQEQICSAFAAHNISCPGQVQCNDVRMRLSCRRGTLSASIRATPSTPITVILDGITEQDVTTSGFGRVFLRWPDAGSGSHEVCVEGCEESCAAVTCE